MASDESASTESEGLMRAALAAAALCAALLDLVVTWQLKQSTDPTNYRLLVYAAAYYIFEQRAKKLRFDAGPAGIAIACVLLSSAVLKACAIMKGDDYYHFLSTILGLGVGLLAFRWRELRRLWSIGLLLVSVSFFDNPFSSFVISRLHLDQLGARISAGLLLLGGYPAVAQKNLVLLPSSVVEVAGGCSSAQPLLYLLKLTLLALFVFRTSAWQKAILICSAVAIALVGNAIRIAVMAVLASIGDTVRFEFWHLGTGSSIFSTFYLVLFCCLCAACLRRGSR